MTTTSPIWPPSHAVRDDRVAARGDAHARDRAADDHAADKAQALVASDQRIVRVEELVGGVEELAVRVEPASSTSTNMRPNAVVVAAVVVPGTKNVTSVVVLLTAVKSRLRAEGLEVAREAEQRRRRLARVRADEKARPRRAEDDAARRVDVEEVGRERIRVGLRGGNAVPVDLAPEAAERAVRAGRPYRRRRQHGMRRASA